MRKANLNDLKRFGVSSGVEIIRALTPEVARYGLEGNLIISIDDIKVTDIVDVKQIMDNRRYSDPLKMTFINKKGETHSYIFR